MVWQILLGLGLADIALFAAIDSAILSLEAYYETPDYGAKGPYYSIDYRTNADSCSNNRKD